MIKTIFIFFSFHNLKAFEVSCVFVAHMQNQIEELLKMMHHFQGGPQGSGITLPTLKEEPTQKRKNLTAVKESTSPWKGKYLPPLSQASFPGLQIPAINIFKLLSLVFISPTYCQYPRVHAIQVSPIFLKFVTQENTNISVIQAGMSP